jgi:hypothetical protein
VILFGTEEPSPTSRKIQPTGGKKQQQQQLQAKKMVVPSAEAEKKKREGTYVEG